MRMPGPSSNVRRGLSMRTLAQGIEEDATAGTRGIGAATNSKGYWYFRRRLNGTRGRAVATAPMGKIYRSAGNAMS